MTKKMKTMQQLLEDSSIGDPGRRDRALLKDLLAAELGADERQAFQSMADYLSAHVSDSLKRRQRGWVQARHNELELDAGEALNLHSAGLVPDGLSRKGEDGKRVPLPYETMTRPKYPPGRAPKKPEEPEGGELPEP